MKWRHRGDDLEPGYRFIFAWRKGKPLLTSVSRGLITLRESLSSLLQIAFSFVYFTHRSKWISLKQRNKQTVMAESFLPQTELLVLKELCKDYFMKVKNLLR